MLRPKSSKSILVAVLGFLASEAAFSSASACDPNEECNRCLVSGFGGCLVRGNDPACEIRKAACNTAGPAAGTVLQNAVPWLRPGGPATITPQEVQRCIADIGSCPAQILARAGYQALKPALDQYIAFLRAQGTPYSFDQDFINRVQRYYPFDLTQVRYGTNIQTVHGAAITIGNQIFFPVGIDLQRWDDSLLMYHELQHVDQYRRRGGIEPFMTEYVLKSAGGLIDVKNYANGNFAVNVHDNLDLERDAESKAQQVAQGVVQAAQSTVRQPQIVPGQYSQVCVVGPRPTDRCMVTQPLPLNSGCTCIDSSGRPWYGGIWR